MGIGDDPCKFVLLILCINNLDAVTKKAFKIRFSSKEISTYDDLIEFVSE